MPFNLAKSITVFVSCHYKMKNRIWLVNQGYLEHIICKGFHDTALKERPTPYKDKKNTLPLVTTYNNVDSKLLVIKGI